MSHKVTSEPCFAHLAAVTPKKTHRFTAFRRIAQKLRNKLIFDAVALPLRKMQRAMVPHRDAFMTKCLDGYNAITSGDAGRLDAALVTPVCHIRFLSRGERGPIPQSLSGIKRGGIAMPFLLDTLLSFASSAFRMFACGLFGPIEPFLSVTNASFTLLLRTRLRVRRGNYDQCYLRRAKRRAANAAADAAIAAPAASKPRTAEVSFVFANFAGLSAFF